MALSPEEAQAKVRAAFGSEIEVKPVSAPIVDEDPEIEVIDLITRVCYFYPQYTVETAQQLPNSTVTALLLQAEKQRAIELYNYALIAAAPHTKKGALVGKLVKQYKKIAES
jgi:hypothetical protein